MFLGADRERVARIRSGFCGAPFRGLEGEAVRAARHEMTRNVLGMASERTHLAESGSCRAWHLTAANSTTSRNSSCLPLYIILSGNHFHRTGGAACRRRLTGMSLCLVASSPTRYTRETEAELSRSHLQGSKTTCKARRVSKVQAICSSPYETVLSSIQRASWRATGCSSVRSPWRESSKWNASLAGIAIPLEAVLSNQTCCCQNAELNAASYTNTVPCASQDQPHESLIFDGTTCLVCLARLGVCVHTRHVVSGNIEANPVAVHAVSWQPRPCESDKSA